MQSQLMSRGVSRNGLPKKLKMGLELTGRVFKSNEEPLSAIRGGVLKNIFTASISPQGSNN